MNLIGMAAAVALFWHLGWFTYRSPGYNEHGLSATICAVAVVLIWHVRWRVLPWYFAGFSVDEVSALCAFFIAYRFGANRAATLLRDERVAADK